MGLLTSYGANNFILETDYNYRCNQIESGVPEVTVELLSGTPQIAIRQWWHAFIEETASFKYVGMSYSAAQDCADEIRSTLTINRYPWTFGSYLSSVSSGLSTTNYMLYGWHKGTSTPVCESEIKLQKHGNGCMYDVVVNARCTTENYDTSSNVLDINNKPLLNIVNSLPGWSEDCQLSGKHFDAASISNITIVVAPTQTVEFELMAENLYTTNPNSLSGFELSNWYKATVDSYAQVKYEGMTKTACRTLYNALNSTNGWYLSAHPWEYKERYAGGHITFEWQQNNDVTTWQCFNTYKAIENESGMFTAELTLHAQDITMTSDPSNFTPQSYPSFWASKVPGLANYL